MSFNVLFLKFRFTLLQKEETKEKKKNKIERIKQLFISGGAYVASVGCGTKMKGKINLKYPAARFSKRHHHNSLSMKLLRIHIRIKGNLPNNAGIIAFEFEMSGVEYHAGGTLTFINKFINQNKWNVPKIKAGWKSPIVCSILFQEYTGSIH